MDRIDRGVMLAVRQDDRVRTRLATPPQALDRQIHRLGAARGEDHLDRIAVQHRREPLTGLFEEPSGVLAGAVDR
jgi:hypothetical protein